MNEVRIVVTGHRPNKLGGYDANLRTRLAQFAWRTLGFICGGIAKGRRPGESVRVAAAAFNPGDLRVYTGMAQGWDQAIAAACADSGIPFIAVVPCIGQENVWPAAAQVRYAQLLQRAREIRYEPGGPYAKWKMQTRNVHMVDQLRLGTEDLFLPLWNGTPGGTHNCVAYAAQRGVRERNVWQDWEAWRNAT